MVASGITANIEGFEVSALMLAGGGVANAFRARDLSTGREFHIHVSRRDVDAPGGLEHYLVAEVVAGRAGRAARTASIHECLVLARRAVDAGSGVTAFLETRNVA